MSENTIISRFCKSGDLHHLSRRFHNLDRSGKEHVLELIKAGKSPDDALKIAKSKQQKLF